MHRLWHEPPDMLWGTFVGTVTPEDVRCMMTLYEEVTRQGPVYVISDVAHSDLPPESRKYIAEHGHPEWMCGLVYIGADVRQQAISKALSVAILFSSTARFETVFVDTLDQAREWVEANRARRAQQRVG
jgi:hypothetical protein